MKQNASFVLRYLLNVAHVLPWFCLNPALAAVDIPDIPLAVNISATPLTLLTAARDHKLYYEAYNDASDLNGDGSIDVGYQPTITYYGYFDSYKCYSYNSSNGVFEPAYTTVNKTCANSSGEWSGDFLNYLTMSRMDALRRVLYGGYRSTDTDSATILERVYIPQDAHSWGKEYTSTAVDGYDISSYTPLSQPATDKRHLFANTTLLETTTPLLRVLENSGFRVWEWLSIERPVAGSDCATGNNVRTACAVAGSTSWEIVPASYFSGLTQATYNTGNTSRSGNNCYCTYPTTNSEFNSLETNYATSSRRYGSKSVTQINGSGNPNSSASGSQDNYLTLFEGTLTIPTGKSGTYTFAVDGDDAVEVIIDGTVVAWWYGGHGSNNSDTSLTSHSGSIYLSAGAHTVKFRHQERDGGDSYYLYWKKTVVASTLTDYAVRVKACVSGLLESECRGYPSASPVYYKPGGILQQYGETDAMAFGLMTGSYEKNTSGGVLRKNISPLTNEIDLNTGQLTSTVGVIKALDKLKVTGFGDYYFYHEDCGVPEVGGPLAQGRCRMWGNPIAEIMYEGLRYLSGATSPTTAFDISASGNDDTTLGLPKPDWLDPYRTTTGGYPRCSKPSQIVISDISPNYDTDQLPGRYEYTAPSGLTSFSGDSSINGNSLGVKSLGDQVWATEFEGAASKNFFIGQSGNTYDGAPTVKSASSFGSIRGLVPEEPTQQGGYYPASVAFFGKTKDINSVTDAQNVDTYSVALASPKPQMTFSVNDKTITLVPFGKTVGGCLSASILESNFRPTNTIVDFYVISLKNTNSSNQDSSVNSGRPYAKFRINYEDSEYGSDHDMDAIVEYELSVTSSNKLDVKLTSDYAAGGCIQHMGYVISGTTADGTYLDVRDSDTDAASDVNYALDTPDTSSALPLTNTRTFTPGNTSSGSFVPHDPLWYAAKWGGFSDLNNNKLPDLKLEWDADSDNAPDTYFYVQNPLKLKESLRKAFDKIIDRTASASNVTSNSTSILTDTQVFQSLFSTATWSGSLRAFPISTGSGVGDTFNWDAAEKIPTHTGRKIFTKTGGTATEFLWANLTTTDQAALISENVTNWLRGDSSNEVNSSESGTLRDRTSTVLGDIVHSSPYYIKDTETVFVGANDGMLHAFDAETGVELFAYIPSILLPKLKYLSQINYGSDSNPHDYFVDGEIAVSSTSQTPSHNYLISTLGHGGKGLFGLEVISPSSFSASNVLWEYFDATDADLGYMLGRPVIAKMNDGTTALIVGNGYNSSDGKAVLYIFNLTTGAVIKKIDTLVAGDNGLASPGVFDNDNDGDVDFIYAGDLKGNVWKFDVSASSAGSWDVAFKSGITPAPFFVAQDENGTAQPITAQITVAVDDVQSDANYGKRFIWFGSGSYFVSADPANLNIQTWYGLIDQNAQISGRTTLKQRTVVAEGTFDGNPVRTLSASTDGDMIGKNGWYLDLTLAAGTAQGERIVTSSKVYKLAQPTLIASSIIPDDDPCKSGGSGYVNAVNPYTGARLTIGIFDVNGKNKFEDDKLNDILISSIDLDVGMPSEPVLVGNRLVVGGSKGEIKDLEVNVDVTVNKGRISWRELIFD
ncbi:PilC/PilY family type IV pilus protein [Methylomonas rhizoryzae]|uniref:PilC/PilY family type IV pilus protein n=1 Tax=Methylomonas rhizoryzae TaxID=2608981 RepID=UPI00123268F1|nr:PilC/PilY family type IV pilus protein [Methylomonas rhizoryzae]